MTGLVVFGVAGSGKTTVGTALAHHMGVAFADGDDFHPPANVQKMTAGIPLSDDDRWPWLHRISEWVAQHPSAVVACSALRRAYRDRLRPARFVYLRIGFDAALDRIGHRAGHFFGPTLLESQFAALEEPDGEGDVLVADATQTVDTLVRLILS